MVRVAHAEPAYRNAYSVIYGELLSPAVPVMATRWKHFPTAHSVPTGGFVQG